MAESLGSYAPKSRPTMAARVARIQRAPLGRVKLVDVSELHVRGWVSAMYGEGLKTRTVALNYGTLRQILSTVVPGRVAALGKPSKLLRPVVEKEVSFLTVQQVAQLADAMPERHRAMILVQAGLGLRISELLALRATDVGWLTGEIAITTQLSRGVRVEPKYGSKRTVTAPPPVMDALREHTRRWSNDRVWTITGNNLNLGGDAVRRALWITIDPGVPDPQTRTGFRLNPPAYAIEHRGEIIRALLILVRAWVEAGMRKQERSSDIYAHWSAVVRGILAHTCDRDALGPPTHVMEDEGNKPGSPTRQRRTGGGIPGEFDHPDSAQQAAGGDDEGWGEFLAALFEVWPGEAFTVRQVVDYMALATPAARGQDEDDQAPPNANAVLADQAPMARDLIDALPKDLHEKLMRDRRRDPTAIAKSLGRWLVQ